MPRKRKSIRKSTQFCPHATRIRSQYSGRSRSRLQPDHAGSSDFSIRTLYSATISGPGIPSNLEAQKRRSEGLFEVTLPETYKDKPDPSKYKIRYKTSSGDTYERYDTYAFPYLLSDFDLYLMGEGRHYDAYEKLGAHITTIAGVKGVNFAVWAPSARRVSIVGDFNHWDGRVHPMRARGSSGIWELFIPELDEGAVYKYEIIGPRGDMLPLKADPYGFRAELRPNTGSIVARLDTHKWADADWITKRKATPWLEKPISIYEVHLGGWRRNPTKATVGSAIANLPSS